MTFDRIDGSMIAPNYLSCHGFANVENAAQPSEKGQNLIDYAIMKS